MLHGRAHDARRILRQAVRPQPNGVGAQGVGLHHLRARADVVVVDGAHGVGPRQVQRLRARKGHRARRQLAAKAAVEAHDATG